MDSVIQHSLDELIHELKDAGRQLSDPVAKLMVMALLHQSQKIRDDIAGIPGRVAERLCSTYVPKNKVDAFPAMCLVQPTLKARRDIAPQQMVDGCYFSYKISPKQSLAYYPLLRNLLLPVVRTFLLTPSGLRSQGSIAAVHFERKGQVWLGMETPAEIETLEGVSFLIRGTSGVLPRRIAVSNGEVDLCHTVADNLGDIPAMDPFDAQQLNPRMVDVFAGWQRRLAATDQGRLVYVTDTLRDRDTFKCRAYPKAFQQLLESNDLDRFNNNTLWVLFDFGPDYEVPADIEILPNVVPVVNVAVGSVALTQSSPIAKLTKDDGSYFLSVLETPLSQQRQGFALGGEEFVIRDFDTAGYNPDTLFKDVRNLYNRFIDDYYAFVDYYGLKDGELIRSLRELVNRVGKSVTAGHEAKNRYDEGAYAMRNVNLPPTASTAKVAYLTTFGRLGNTPRRGELMDNRRDAALERDVLVVADADGGEDKASADQLYEMLRYYTLTADRIYTRMDLDAFLRLELLREYGQEEMKRISHSIAIHGAGGPSRLMRGIYIDIRFKDEKNYRRALAVGLDRRLRRLIDDKSCLSMPVVIALVNDDVTI